MWAILQVHYEHDWKDDEMAALSLDWAKEVKPTIPGLVWKIFAKDPSGGACSGVYLFESAQAADAFVNGEVFQAVKSMPEVNKLVTRISEVMEEPSKVAGVPGL